MKHQIIYFQRSSTGEIGLAFQTTQKNSSYYKLYHPGFMKKVILSSLMLSLSTGLLHAQVSYQNEKNNTATIWSEENGLYLNWYNNNFFKNNEYFLNTASGYPLFGTQHIPSLLYKPNKHLFVQGGVYLKKDFGTEGFAKVAPYYLVSLHKNGYSLSFGNINANINHRMYDPIFANERLMTHQLEEGLSLKVNRRKIYSETWINWEKQQYYFSDFNEQFTIGHHTDLKLYEQRKFSIGLPVQALAIHSGGQLDTTSNPTSTIVNVSVGIKADLKINRSKRSINRIGFNANYLLYKDLSANSGLAYSEGNALYANLNVKMFRHFHAALSYWKSDRFIAPKGDILYQSISSNPKNLNYLEQNRELIQLGLAYEKRVAKAVNLSVRLQPFYDFSNSRLDYSYSLFLTLQPNVRLLKQHIN